MEVEYRIHSDHFSWDDLALSKAINKYTSAFWPFGREGRARKKLKEEREKFLDKHGIEKESHLGITTLVVKNAENFEQAEEKMEALKRDIEKFYKEEFGIDEPFEYSVREPSKRK